MTNHTEELDTLKQSLDFLYEQIKPSQALRDFLSLYAKYIKLQVQNGMEDNND